MTQEQIADIRAQIVLALIPHYAALPDTLEAEAIRLFKLIGVD